MENLFLLVIKAICDLKAWDVGMAVLGFLICQYAMQRKQKGPILWPVLGIIPSLFYRMNEIYDWMTDTLINCGGTFPYRGVWMGGAFGVVTSDPANIEHILKTRFTIYPKGKYYRERFHDLLGDGIFNADDEEWRDQRRAANTELHTSSFFDYTMTTMETLVHDKLLPLLEDLSRKKSCIDFQDVLLRFTFDNICMAAFGVDPGCLGIDLPDVPFAKAFEQATEATVFRFLLPPFCWKTMRYLNVGIERTLRIALKTVGNFTARTVASRKKEYMLSQDHAKENGDADLLSRLIQLNNKGQNPHCSFSDKYLQDFCISFILAGRDTTSVGLAWFFWLLNEHPEVENKIFLEILGILKHRPGFNTESGLYNYSYLKDQSPFSVEELKQMDYLHAALSEALRLYPSVPIDFKEATEDNVLPDGTYLKKGARVVYSMFTMGRTESIWGKDCREFKPERWLKDGSLVNESAFKYPVFNAGPRLCLGKKFAYMQMKWVAASIILRYCVRVVDGHPVLPKLSTTLYMKHGLLVTFSPRNVGV
eukprot:Gb_00170 [translate_table: standard]